MHYIAHEYLPEGIVVSTDHILFGSNREYLITSSSRQQTSFKLQKNENVIYFPYAYMKEMQSSKNA